MKPGCPNWKCKNHSQNQMIIYSGTYFRKNDSRTIQRFLCKCCGKRFSRESGTIFYRLKKRRIHSLLRGLLASGVSMRRAAKLLAVDKKTIARKLIILAAVARKSQENFLTTLRSRPINKVQFDDLITIEHTKMKPLTVSIAVDKDGRAILGAEVGQIPAFGHLAEKSRKKYGKRKNFHRKTLDRLFKKIHPSIAKDALIESDEHKLYPSIVAKYLPQSTHKRFKGGRGCVVGQGELKKLHWDPLFKINHSCAMLRGNINRLIRKSWCTTKAPQMLKCHLDIFIDFYNRDILLLH